MIGPEPTYTQGRTCEACEAPVPDGYTPNAYELYGYCPACVVDVGDDPPFNDDAEDGGENDQYNQRIAEAFARDEPMAYIGRAACGCIRAVSVDDPEQRSLVARDVAHMIATNLTVEVVPVAAIPKPLTRPDCVYHQPKRQAAPVQPALI